MRSMLSTIFAVLAAIALAAGPAGAVVMNQLDDFQDGTTQGWAEGPPSPNPPVNVQGGGPGGAGDDYLRNVSSGTFGAGSRQVIINTDQWTGDYVAAGVAGLEAAMANFGAETVQMRVTLSGPQGTISSTNAIPVPPGGTWDTVVFSLRPVDLTQISGGGTIQDILSNVTSVRILAAAAGPTFIGDSIATTMCFDNLRAVPGPIAVEPARWGQLKVSF